MSTLTSNGIGDGSWNLTVAVSELNVERTLRVRGDLHVGGLMLQLVETLGELAFIG
jgi:Kindlin-2 N-terminal domain